MGWYVVIKTIKGRHYYYRQTTWREGKHVRTKSIYLGGVDCYPRWKEGGRTPKMPPAHARKILGEDSESTDDEMAAEFVRNGASPRDAGDWVAQRISFLNNPMMRNSSAGKQTKPKNNSFPADYARAMMSNDEGSTDDEMTRAFREHGATPAEASNWIKQRDFYRNNIVDDDGRYWNPGSGTWISDDRYIRDYNEAETFADPLMAEQWGIEL